MRLTKHICDHMLIRYPDLVRERADLERYIEATHRGGEGDGSVSGGDCPAEQERIVMAKEKSHRLEKLSRCVELIGGALDSLTEDQRRMIDLRYWAKGQTLPVSMYDLCGELGLPPQTAKRRYDEVMNVVERALYQAYGIMTWGVYKSGF